MLEACTSRVSFSQSIFRSVRPPCRICLSAGNNNLVSEWRPSLAPSDKADGIEFSNWPTAGVSRAAAAPTGGRRRRGQTGANPDTCRSIEQTKNRTPPSTTRAKTAVSVSKQRADCGRLGVNDRSGVFREASPAAPTSTATTTTTTTEVRRGGASMHARPKKAVRRPWGAGPGATPPSMSRDVSRRRASTSREARAGGKACKTDRHSTRNIGGGDSSRVRLSSRPPTVRRFSASRKEESPLGATATSIEQFLPTWTALVAEAVWLRSAEATAARAGGVVVGGGGEDSDGGVRSRGDGIRGGGGGGGGGGRHGRSYLDVIGASAPPDSNGERFDNTMSSRSHEHPGQTSTSSDLSTVGRFRSRQKSVGGERDSSSKGWARGRSHQGCYIPAPSLDPGVERVLMDWLRSRVNR